MMAIKVHSKFLSSLAASHLNLATSRLLVLSVGLCGPRELGKF